MAMHLAGIPPSIIKLTGRWSSEAFMDYIRPQVAKFSATLSKSMIAHDTFFTIPHNNNLPNHQHQYKHGLQLIVIPNPTLEQ